MRVLLIFFIFISICFANDINIEEEIFIDKSRVLSINDVIKKYNNFTSIQRYNLGITEDNIWVSLKIKNNSSSTVIKRVYNKRIGINFIDIYLTSNHQVQSHLVLGDMTSYDKKYNHARIPYFDIRLEPKETINIYIKHKSYAPLEVKWDISSIEEFNSFENIQNNLYFTFLGALFVATIVSLIFFIVTKEIHYLIYSLFTICNITFQFSIAGFFYEIQIPLYINTVFLFSFPLFTMVLLGLFPLYFFQLNKMNYKYTIYSIYLFNWLLFGIAILNMFYPINHDILYMIKLTNILIIVFFTLLTVLSIKLYKDRTKGAIFYMLSNILAWFGITYHILSVAGVIPTSLFHYFSLAVSSMMQDVFLAVALVQASYLIKKEHEKNTELLAEYSKLSFIGQTMVNISHQWKNPINSIYNCINHIEVAREFKDKNIDSIINNNLEIIKETTAYLKDTALSQLHFYKEEKNIEEIEIDKEINYVIKLMNNEFIKKSIDVQLNCKDNMKIKIEKNYFLNILMILFENSFKAFERRDIKKPIIKIFVKRIGDKTEVIFEDNAGGVSGFFVTRIFEKDFSDSSSTGIGLYLAKEIITQKLQGKITAKNKNEGLCFRILI